MASDIASWFGQGSRATDGHWPALFQAARGHPASGGRRTTRTQGIADPSPAAIAADLHYLRTRYTVAAGSALAMMPGGPLLVFIYNSDDRDTAHGCATVSRWHQAEGVLRQRYGEKVYVDLKLFRHYSGCPGGASIAGWRSTNRECRAGRLGGAGAAPFAISPGSGNGAEHAGRESRPAAAPRWKADIAAMNRSAREMDLITTYNEWGEGTAIESSSGCRVTPPPGTILRLERGRRHLRARHRPAQRAAALNQTRDYRPIGDATCTSRLQTGYEPLYGDKGLSTDRGVAGMGIVVTRDGAIALVQIDRQASLNALDIETVSELELRVRELGEDGGVRCVVLTGAGDRAFIGGADLEYMSRVTPAQAREFADVGHELGRLLETMPKPTIAAVNGYALGGGCEVALACDIRYASSTAKLGQPEVSFGLIPGWGGSEAWRARPRSASPRS